MIKGDVGMAKHFSKKSGNKGWATCNPKVMSTCLSATDATSLYHCLLKHRHYFTILSWIQALDTKRPVTTPSPFYPASVVLFQLHGGIVNHMQVFPTPSSTVHNTKYLDPYHISFSCLFLRQWCIGIKMVLASTLSANEPAKDLF